MTRAVATMFGAHIECPAARASGPKASPRLWSPWAPARRWSLALPLAKHSLDCVVHLGVLVVLGGHQELLNNPKNAI